MDNREAVVERIINCIGHRTHRWESALYNYLPPALMRAKGLKSHDAEQCTYEVSQTVGPVSDDTSNADLRTRLLTAMEGLL